jgi:hypothetical protein
MEQGPRIARRSVLALAAVTLAAACSPGGKDVPPIMKPVAPSASPPKKASYKLKSVADWTKVYEQSWDYQTTQMIPQSRTGDSWDHYNISYLVDANTAMYRATGSTRYLERALQYVENVVATSKVSSSMKSSQYKDKYRGWVSFSEDIGGTGEEVPLYESYFWRYASALLRTIHADAKALDAYRARYQKLLEFAEVDIFEKWFTRGANENIYRSRTHLVSHWALIALNLSMVTTDDVRRGRYREVYTNIDHKLPNANSSLRRQMRRNPANEWAYFWNDVWGSAKRPGQDTAHGNGVMAYVVDAHDYGEEWTDADMAGFSALLTKVIWPGGKTYHGYVDGSGSDNGWYSDGYVKLGRYDPRVQQRLDAHLVVNEQFAANMALNAKILA